MAHFHRPALAFAALLLAALATGCSSMIPMPDLGERYNRTAQYHGPDRNPVIVIPGILGSKLTHPPTGMRVWGAFERSAADPGSPEGARLIALPMSQGKPLAELTDDVEPDGALDSIRLRLLGLPLELKAYAQILGTLGVGGYVDDQLGRSGAIDYGTDHYSCFQFDYDWRRDNVENAQALMAFIEKTRPIVQANLAEDYGGVAEDYDVKFDIVAHSMGGMITRYMMRYGGADLPKDGGEPEVTWAGAKYLDRVVLVGTPNGGSVDALVQLVNGTKFLPFHAGYTQAVLGSMPSIYQLLPRDRHHRVRREAPPGQEHDPDLDPFVNLLEGTEAWEQLGWGLASPELDPELQKLLPDVDSAEERRAIALDHLAKCVERARRFHAALDRPARLPDNVSLILYAGDGAPTNDIAVVDRKNRIARLTKGSGDGTVTRESAVMDERLGESEHDDLWTPHLVTPIEWTDVNFLFTTHLGLTADPVFADNVLYLLLESPKRKAPSDAADVMDKQATSIPATPPSATPSQATARQP